MMKMNKMMIMKCEMKMKKNNNESNNNNVNE